MKLANNRVAILATNGYEQSELEKPLQALRNEGATVEIVSDTHENIKGWADGNWSGEVSVDKTLDEASESDYNALVLPGGVINPDLMRTNEKGLSFIRDFFASGKPVSAICHAPWLLASAGVVENRKITSYHSIKDDMINAGANWVDESVVVDKGLTTSRNPDDMDDFISKTIEEIAEGKHEDQVLNA